jgi:hypothetical protein
LSRSILFAFWILAVLPSTHWSAYKSTVYAAIYAAFGAADTPTFRAALTAALVSTGVATVLPTDGTTKFATLPTTNWTAHIAAN